MKVTQSPGSVLHLVHTSVKKAAAEAEAAAEAPDPKCVRSQADYSRMQLWTPAFLRGVVMFSLTRWPRKNVRRVDRATGDVSVRPAQRADGVRGGGGGGVPRKLPGTAPAGTVSGRRAAPSISITRTSAFTRGPFDPSGVRVSNFQKQTKKRTHFIQIYQFKGEATKK